MKRILTVSTLVLATLPSFAFAALGQVTSYGSGIAGIIAWITAVLGYVFPLIVSLSVIFIIWYIFKYAVAGGEDDKAKAKTHIIWGIVGLFIMVSIWGLVAILTQTAGFTSNSANLPPAQNYFPVAQ